MISARMQIMKAWWNWTKNKFKPVRTAAFIRTVIFMQGWLARLPGKAAEQGCRAWLHGNGAIWQFGDLPLQLIAERARAVWWPFTKPHCGAHARSLVTCRAVWWPATAAYWSFLINVSTPRTTTTTKQNLDPRCTYVQTRVKRFLSDSIENFHSFWNSSCASPTHRVPLMLPSRWERLKPVGTALRLQPPQVGATEKRSEMVLSTLLLQKLY
jgi:hypothetical protein